MPNTLLTFTVPRIVAQTIGIWNIPNAARLAGVLDDRFSYRPVSQGFVVECSCDVAVTFLAAFNLFIERRDVSAEFLAASVGFVTSVGRQVRRRTEAQDN